MTDAAAEPLIGLTRDVPDDARDHYNHDEEETDEDVVDESQLVSPGLFIWSLTICAGISGLLFGFEYGSQSFPLYAMHFPAFVASNELITVVPESYPLP
jgi:SP family myo-inositol transporter-like MFS transporter 13